MSETNGTGELLNLASGFSAEKLAELETRIEFGHTVRHNAGLVSGLSQAVEAVEGRWPEAAAALRELAAAAAEYARREKWYWDEANKRFADPAVRAEMDAEIACIESGEAEMVPFEDVLRELDEAQQRWDDEKANAAQKVS